MLPDKFSFAQASMRRHHSEKVLACAQMFEQQVELMWLNVVKAMVFA
jgi:hypothetical protein